MSLRRKPLFETQRGLEFNLRNVGSASLAIISLTLFSCLGNPAASSSRECAMTRTVVEAADSATIDAVCDAAVTAVATLAQCGIRDGKGLRVVIHEGSVSLWELPVFGAFEIASRTLHITHIAEAETLMKGHTALRELDRSTFYKSIIVHEMAHAIVHDWLAGRPTNILVAEYAAFAAQFVAMPADMRENLLAHYPASASVTLDDFRLIVLILDPFSYGAMTYQHFSHLADGCRWLKELLEGSVGLPGAAE
jgi:hypothetical protein